MNKRILAIGAHPDDIEIGCGGTIRLLADQGCEIKFVVVTSGEEGSLSDKEKLRMCRETEARNSAQILGASEVIFLNEDDGLRTFTKLSKIRLIQIIRDFKPDMAFIHTAFDSFPDHKVVHELSRSAILASGGPWYSEGGQFPHSIGDVFGFEVWNPIPQAQVTVNISKNMELKLKALACHQTQITNVDYVGAVRGLNEYRGGVSMSGKYAESFEVLKLELKL